MDNSPKWDRVVFSMGSRQIMIGDVLRAAQFRGELDAAWKEVCQRAAQGDFEADEDLAQASSEEFRGERDLITAEETEQWLEARGLTLDEFSDYFLRCQVKVAQDAVDTSPAIVYEEASSELRDQLRIDLIVGGEFDRLAEQLAWRFASRAGPDAVPPREGEAELAELEDAYQQQRALVLTPEARGQALTLLRLPLTRVELQVLELESDDAAHEALFCLREDGETMADVARDGGYSLRHRQWWAGEMAEDLQLRLLSALPGEVLGPFPNGEEFQIYRLEGKIEPELSDAAVSARVDEHLVNNHFAALLTAHVRWLIAPLQNYA